MEIFVSKTLDWLCKNAFHRKISSCRSQNTLETDVDVTTYQRKKLLINFLHYSTIYRYYRFIVVPLISDRILFAFYSLGRILHAWYLKKIVIFVACYYLLSYSRVFARMSRYERREKIYGSDVRCREEYCLDYSLKKKKKKQQKILTSSTSDDKQSRD